MKLVVILAALIAVSYEQAHTTVSGPTHEPSESVSIFFHYDYVSFLFGPTSKCTFFLLYVSTSSPVGNASIFVANPKKPHKMSLRYGHTCYIFTLTDQQKLDVHTDAGIKALELKLLSLIDSGHKTLVQKSDLSAELQRACGRTSTQFYTMS